MPALTASGRSCQASITACRSASMCPFLAQMRLILRRLAHKTPSFPGIHAFVRVLLACFSWGSRNLLNLAADSAFRRTLHGDCAWLPPTASCRSIQKPRGASTRCQTIGVGRRFSFSPFPGTPGPPRTLGLTAQRYQFRLSHASFVANYFSGVVTASRLSVVSLEPR